MNHAPLRILHVNTSDQAGGAEKVAYELHTACRQHGHPSHLAVGRKTRTNDDSISVLNHDTERPAWTRYWRAQQLALCQKQIHVAPVLAGWLADLAEPRAWRERTRGWENFDAPGTWRLFDAPRQRPDVLHLHNLHGGYFDLRALPWLSQQAPTVITLHDEWLLTGHCAYTFDSDRWEHGCQHCPDLEVYPPLRRDTTAQNWRRKQQLYARSRVYIAAASQWLLDRACRSILQPAIIEARVIPYGISLTHFKPADKHAARQALGLPLDAAITLYAGNNARSNPFKDYDTIEAALQRLSTRNLPRELLLICLGQVGETEQRGSVTLRFAGFEHDPQRVAQYYQAADVYLHAARAEAFGLVIAEAMACGTPVIATAVGGIPEVVRDGETGFLVALGDAAAMADRLEQLLKDAALTAQLGRQAAVHARQAFDLQRQVESYLDWYQEMQGQTQPAR